MIQYTAKMDSLHPQLAEILRELDAVVTRVQRLAQETDDREFSARPREGAWSIAECLTHLNLTTQAYLPLIDEARRNGDQRHVVDSYRYRKDILGRLLCWMIEPPSRMKVKTTAPFQPVDPKGKAAVIEEFLALQKGLAERIARAVGRDLNRIRIASPFNERVTYNLYSGLKLLPAHQRRHLFQAERAVSAQVR